MHLHWLLKCVIRTHTPQITTRTPYPLDQPVYIRIYINKLIAFQYKAWPSSSFTYMIFVQSSFPSKESVWQSSGWFMFWIHIRFLLCQWYLKSRQYKKYDGSTMLRKHAPNGGQLRVARRKRPNVGRMCNTTSRLQFLRAQSQHIEKYIAHFIHGIETTRQCFVHIHFMVTWLNSTAKSIKFYRKSINMPFKGISDMPKPLYDTNYF